jgi:UDP-N-acetylmuramoyl-tripeptide--D-alanyl-D-alanine ligase
VPLTLLRLRAAHRVAVVELGMNHPGEIAYLAGIAQPTVALVNNAQREHLEFMATVEAVARENGSVLAALPGNGVAVFPAGDAYTPLWAALAGPRCCLAFWRRCARRHPFGCVGQWRRGTGRWRVPRPPARCTLPAYRRPPQRAQCAGRHRLRAGRRARRWPPSRAGWRPSSRSRAARAPGVCGCGAAPHLVDDTYNANPDSVRAAIDVLAELPARACWCWATWARWATRGRQFHAEVATTRASAASSTCSRWASRPPPWHAAGATSTTSSRCSRLCGRLLPRVASVLVKGSRFMRMERVVEVLTAASQEEQDNKKEAAHAA